MRMLKLDPHNRPSADEAVDVLENYIKNQKWTLKDLEIDIPNFKMVLDEFTVFNIDGPCEEEEDSFEGYQ